MIVIPKHIAEEAGRRGLDLEEFVLRALGEALNLDPEELLKTRVEIAERNLAEAREYAAKGNPIQASEKLYRAVEECIKALVEKHKTPQLEIVRKRGRWDTWLLGQAATDLSKMLGEERIKHTWAVAYDVHVWGPHDAKYRVEDVDAAMPLAEWLLNYTKRAIKAE